MTGVQTCALPILLAIDHKVPKVMTLKQMIQKYVEFQDEVVRRRTQYDLKKAILLFLNGGAAAQGDLAAAGGVGGTDAAAAHDNAGSGEVRALDILHQAGQDHPARPRHH